MVNGSARISKKVERGRGDLRVISRNLKLWRGIDKCLGGVNMHKVQIYIKKH